MSRTVVEFFGYCIEFFFRVDRKVSAFGKILTKQPVGVFVAAPLPRTSRVTEVNLNSTIDGEALVLGHLL